MWHCLCLLCWFKVSIWFQFSALIVRFLTKRFIGDYEANTGKHYDEAMLLWSCTDLQKCSYHFCFSPFLCFVIDFMRLSAFYTEHTLKLIILVSGLFSFSTFLGALYSRKINLDGEQVSLQVQDTPCVSLQVPPDHISNASFHLKMHQK